MYEFQAISHHEHTETVGSLMRQEVNSRKLPYTHHKLFRNILFYLKCQSKYKMLHKIKQIKYYKIMQLRIFLSFMKIRISRKRINDEFLFCL